MDDLRRRFASLDRLQPPDLWHEIGLRAASLDSTGRGVAMSDGVPIGGRSRLAFRLAVAMLLLALLAGIVAVGSRLLEQRTAVLPPDPSPPADASPRPSPVPESTLPPGLIAYSVHIELDPGQGACTSEIGRLCGANRIWLANVDGTGAHELMPGGFDDQQLLAWAPDGSQLLYGIPGALAITDIAGSAPLVIGIDQLCVVDNCPFMDFFAFSPDGTRLSYVMDVGDGGTVIALYDLSTGTVTELESTATTNPSLPCSSAAHEGVNEWPRWSPDGSQLVFARQVIGPLNAAGQCQSALYTVNVDGSDLRQLVGTDLKPLDAHWSPDGSLISFRREEIVPGADPDAEIPVNVHVYTVRPDGSDPRQLTDDGMSLQARWTSDGRIVFVRWVAVDEYGLWIMDASGGNQAPLDSTSLAALSAAGCMACPYPASGGGTDALWQPVP